MKALLAAAIAVTSMPALADAAQDQNVEVRADRPGVVFTVAPSDPRARPMPSFFGARPWTRWYCNVDGSNCHVIRRHRTLVACRRAVAFYLAEIRGRTGRCTHEGDDSQSASAS